MAITVKDLMHSAQVVLNDLGAVARWPLPELLDWINLGATRICTAKPNANTKPQDIPLVAGSEQAIPPDAVLLVRVLSVKSLAGAIRSAPIVSRRSLDALVPGWQDPAVHAATALPDNTIYDPADPDIFHVYPPNDGAGAVLRADLALVPTPIPAPGVPDDINSYTMALPIGDDFQGALLDYVLYRAFSKDSALPNAAGRSQAHFQAFQIAIGEKIQRDVVMNATTANTLPKT